MRENISRKFKGENKTLAQTIFHNPHTECRLKKISSLCNSEQADYSIEYSTRVEYEVIVQTSVLGT